METSLQEPIACPVCAADVSRIYQRKNGYEIVVCDVCHVRYVHPMPTALEDLYAENYFAGADEGFGYVDYDADKEPMVGAFKKYLQHVRKLSPQAKSLLDVGAATGFFLDIARTDGFTVAGVEISEFAAQKGRDKGIEMTTGTLDQVSGTYDVISMLDLIEHVTDPRAELKKAHALLAEHGLLVINTPDAGSPYAKLMGPKWHLIVPPEHLFYFDRKNIANLLAQEGFKVELTTTIGKNFTLPYIFRTVHGWLGWSVLSWFAKVAGLPVLRDIALPINLGDNMFVIARKV